MRRSQTGILKYLFIAAVLIIAMVAIIRRSVPDEPVDEHAGQVYLNDGFDMVWITPYEGVAASTLKAENFRPGNGLPVYTGSDYSVQYGLDVSEHQWEVDWQTAAQTVDFAYVRLGYRGYTEGGLFVDPWFDTNITGASAAGLDTGVYFFSQATNVGEAIEEAEFVIRELQGYRVNLPVMFDWEKLDLEEARTAGLSSETLTDCAKDYSFWISVPGDFPDYYYQCEFWQCSFNGSVPGVSGEADVNLRFIPAASGS